MREACEQYRAQNPENDRPRLAAASWYAFAGDVLPGRATQRGSEAEIGGSAVSASITLRPRKLRVAIHSAVLTLV
jgi:hypothetical protein